MVFAADSMNVLKRKLHRSQLLTNCDAESVIRARILGRHQISWKKQPSFTLPDIQASRELRICD